MQTQIAPGVHEDDLATPEGRCRNAVRWMRTRMRDRYVWHLVHTKPEIADVMVRVLEEEGERDLAEQVREWRTKNNCAGGG